MNKLMGERKIALIGIYSLKAIKAEPASRTVVLSNFDVLRRFSARDMVSQRYGEAGKGRLLFLPHCHV